MGYDDIYRLKNITEKYYELAEGWFNIPYSTFIKSNYGSFVKIIKNKYKKMNMEEIEYEFFRLKGMADLCLEKDVVEKSYYNLCIDILNKSCDYKLPVSIENKLEIAADNDEKSNDRGFLIKFWSSIFGFLEKISIFTLVRKLTGNRSHRFVDYWVVGNLIAAVFSSLLIYNLSIKSRFLIYSIIIYAILRVFEVIIYQINILLFHPLKTKSYKIKSVPRMVTALINNYVEIMFWYTAMIIALVMLSGGNVYRLKWSSYVTSNILCIVTFDSSSIKDAVHIAYPHFSDLIFLEVISGVIMTIMSLARFIGILPGVGEIDKD